MGVEPVVSHGAHACFSLQKSLLILLLALGGLGAVKVGHAQEPNAVDAGQVVQQSASSNWYDRESQDFVLPKVKSEVEYPLRSDGFIAEKANADARQRALQNQGNTAGTWAGGFNGFSELFSSIVLGGLAAILVVAIVLLLYHSFKNYVPIHWQRKAKEKKIQIDPTRAEDLPFEATQAAYENPLAAAEAFYRSGDYNSAIVLVYGYMLLVLDQGRYIDLQKGKTNRMYLRELRGALALKEYLSTAMLGFEDAYFGMIALSKERFETVWESVPAFENMAASHVTENAQQHPPVEVAAQ